MTTFRYTKQAMMCDIGEPGQEGWRYRSAAFSFEGLFYRLTVVKLRRHTPPRMFLLVKVPLDAEPSRIVRWKVGVLIVSTGFCRWIKTGRHGLHEVTPGWRKVRDWFCPQEELRPGRGPLALVFHLSEKRSIDPVEDSGIPDLNIAAPSDPPEPEYNVTIRVQDETFVADSRILGSCSLLLADMFAGDTEASRTMLLSVDDCEPVDIRNLLEFAHFGTVNNLAPDNVMGTYHAAHKYGVLQLKTICAEFMASNLTVSCICDVIRLAFRHNDELLLLKGIEYVLRNVTEICLSRQWEEFTRDYFNDICEIYEHCVGLI